MINQHNHIQGSHRLLVLAVVIAACAAGQRGLPPQEGIANFGKVAERLYRGAQPDESGIKNLKRLGIKTILNLRMTNEVMKVEEAEARANGMVHTNVPMSGVGRPTPLIGTLVWTMPLARASASSTFITSLVIRRLRMVLMPRRLRFLMPDSSG